MKRLLILLLLLIIGNQAQSQNQFPEFTVEALVNPDSIQFPKTKQYTLLIYGAIGCSYSRYLIENIGVFDSCQNTEIVLLLNDDKESIMEFYKDELDKYRIYSNVVLQYKPKKNNDITPQTFLFDSSKQIFHVKGIKKRMFKKINKFTEC